MEIAVNTESRKSMKNKTVAGTLALMLGIFGVHRFYLGKKAQGVLHLALFFFTMMITIEEEAPAVMIPALLGFIDAVLFFVMPQSDFDAKYNRAHFRAQRLYDPPREAAPDTYDEQAAPPPLPNDLSERRDPYRQLGIRKFRQHDYLGAVEAFQESLHENYENPSTHFNLACTYAMMELPGDAFFHLEKAVSFGFDDFHKIEQHNALSFLRARPEYESFRNNHYQVPAGLPAQKQDLLSSQETDSAELTKESQPLDILDQLLQLGDLREKGLLTEEEFTVQKRKLLEE